ncbi:MAG: glycosyltransferase, partial [Duncaniella sp.]|nr:glycosyltransferase [Duncaniella sp.]
SDIEIILVDDGSPDGCPAICDRLAREDDRIRVIHKANAGLGMARNSGLDVARGEWVAFVDSDDCLALNALEECVAIGRKEMSDEVRFLSDRFDGDVILQSAEVGKECMTIAGFPACAAPIYVAVASLGQFVKTIQSSASAWGGIYRREVMERHGVRFPSERELISEDYVFNLDYARFCRSITYTDSVFYHYRVNPVSLSTVFRMDRMDRMAELADYFRRMLPGWGYADVGFMADAYIVGMLRFQAKHIFSQRVSHRERARMYGELVSHQSLRYVSSSGSWKRLSFPQRLAWMLRKSYVMSWLLVAAREAVRKN